MAVQIYQNEELNDLVFQVEALDEWKQIASELGMEKQLGFVERAETPIPYPHINNPMEIMFKTLCPSVVDYKEYNKTPIPLEVLKQISFSVKDKHFSTIQIWFDDKTPDPFAVGITCSFYAYDSSYNRLKGSDGKEMHFSSKTEAKEYANVTGFPLKDVGETDVRKYLIARWADVIRPLPELKEMAKQRLLEKYGSEIKNTIEDATQALKKINENVVLYLNGELSEGQLKGGRW